MAKQGNDRLFYEITREKPYGNFQMLMVGGSAGSVLGFLIISLVGAYEGMEMDSLVLAFLIASFLGFFFGLLIMWLMITYMEKVIPVSSLVPGMESSPAPVETSASQDEAAPAVVENEEAKGKSVDFVFPELSPDNQ